MSQGKDLLLFVSATTGGTFTELELQGDLRINPGKSLSSTKYKNGEEAAQNDAGFSCSLNMANSAPMATTEALIWTLHDSGDVGYFEIRNAKTGGIEFEFAGRVAITDFNSPTSGANAVSVSIGAVGTVTRGVKS